MLTIMLTEGDIKDMCDGLINFLRGTGWREQLCNELEDIVRKKEKIVLNHIRENQGGTVNVEETINYIWGPMIANLEDRKMKSTTKFDITKYGGAANVLKLKQKVCLQNLEHTLRDRSVNVRNGAARGPPPEYHRSIQEAEYGLGVVPKHISGIQTGNVRDGATRAPPPAPVKKELWTIDMAKRRSASLTDNMEQTEMSIRNAVANGDSYNIRIHTQTLDEFHIQKVGIDEEIHIHELHAAINSKYGGVASKGGFFHNMGAGRIRNAEISRLRALIASFKQKASNEGYIPLTDLDGIR
jgi:hypothetical protein